MIYSDNAATARTSQAAIEAMTPFLRDYFGNPSSPNSMGEKAAKTLKDARLKIAKLLGADENEIIFTSGGSEANNQAILTAAELGAQQGKKRMIISEIEHDSVYKAAKSLENYGFEIITVGVDEKGMVSPQDIQSAIDENTCFVSVMTANNETGSIQPIEEIGCICRNHGIIFHTDAVQAVGHIDVDVKKSNADMLSLSAHKFGGIKGIGALYVRKGITPKPIIIGGNQEFGFRGGTESLPLIAAMAAALQESLDNLPQKQKKTADLRNLLEYRLSAIPDTNVNGKSGNRLCGHLNISFKGINADTLLMLLDEAGICASKGAACHSGEETPSRVLTAMGIKPEYSLGTVRFSLNSENTEEEVNYIADTVINAINNLRAD